MISISTCAGELWRFAKNVAVPARIFWENILVRVTSSAILAFCPFLTLCWSSSPCYTVLGFSAQNLLSVQDLGAIRSVSTRVVVPLSLSVKWGNNFGRSREPCLRSQPFLLLAEDHSAEFESPRFCQRICKMKAKMVIERVYVLLWISVSLLNELERIHLSVGEANVVTKKYLSAQPPSFSLELGGFLVSLERATTKVMFLRISYCSYCKTLGWRGCCLRGLCYPKNPQV